MAVATERATLAARRAQSACSSPWAHAKRGPVRAWAAAPTAAAHRQPEVERVVAGRPQPEVAAAHCSRASAKRLRAGDRKFASLRRRRPNRYRPHLFRPWVAAAAAVQSALEQTDDSAPASFRHRRERALQAAWAQMAAAVAAMLCSEAAAAAMLCSEAAVAALLLCSAAAVEPERRDRAASSWQLGVEGQHVNATTAAAPARSVATSWRQVRRRRRGPNPFRSWKLLSFVKPLRV